MGMCEICHNASVFTLASVVNKKCRISLCNITFTYCIISIRLLGLKKLNSSISSFVVYFNHMDLKVK